jgi:hypothetical protein
VSHGPLEALEGSYQQLRYWDDRYRLLLSQGREGTPVADTIQDSLTAARAIWRLRRDPVKPARLPSADAAALTTMDREARQLLDRPGSAPVAASRNDCLASAPNTLASLTDYTSSCYGRAAERIVVGHDTLNRLEILGRLSREPDPALRRQLFLALQPVWRSVNGDNSVASRYRTLLRLRRAAWGDSGSPILAKAPAFGLGSAELERWLEQALDAWRAASPDTLVEPWNWYYTVGAMTRQLTPRVPALDQIRQVNDAFYRSFGADPVALHIAFDLEVRPGKYPVAFTDFGSRNRWLRGRWQAGAPWVFTSYLSGGVDNLAELLHETGHAVHIACLRTRPAYLDWPDNDTFTEALADLAAHDLYEPAWQQQFLGDSVAVATSLRAKYAGIVFDFAWALFEIRVHATPDADPNVLWADITSRYLRIVPHPELSWWAMRGQLIDGPGYLINYALGAFITADMRAEIARRWGDRFAADARRYQRLCESIYRFGLDVPSRTVLERFLGRPVSPAALLTDLKRLTDS